jgi:hypothetical protein
MKINVQNSINKQKDLPMHPKWWDKYKTTEELEVALASIVDGWKNTIAKYEGYHNKTRHEQRLIDDLEKCIKIVTQ